MLSQNIYLILVTFLAVVGAFFHSAKADPKHKGYIWGYLLSYGGMAGWTILGITFVVQSFQQSSGNSGKFFLMGILCCIVAVPFFFMAKKKKWAWIVGSILSLNPFVWVFSPRYGKNRWHEMT